MSENLEQGVFDSPTDRTGRVKRAVFTPEMKSTHTMLVPMMLPIHFELLAEVFRQDGYKVELLKTSHRGIVDEGLKSVHNDTCYPALLVVGQLMDALKSGKYDIHRVVLVITQTGGGCRASNYLSLLRKALSHAGMGFVPVISVNFSGLETDSSLIFSKKALVKIAFALTYGDMLMWIYNQCRAYEKNPGESRAVVAKWVKEICRQFKSPLFFLVRRNYDRILKDFANIRRVERPRIAVGIVGEIYMKYSALGNNSLEEFLVSQGAEPVVSGVTDFVLYCIRNGVFDHELYGSNKRASLVWKICGGYLISRQQQIINAIRDHGMFVPPTPFSELERLVDGYIGHGAKMGEGWLLTAEMVELITSGVRNIVCTQPFGCLPNHIVAKGMIRKVREQNPQANIVAVDYDPGASVINQENRIKLMLANAYQSAGLTPEEIFSSKPSINVPVTADALEQPADTANMATATAAAGSAPAEAVAAKSNPSSAPPSPDNSGGEVISSLSESISNEHSGALNKGADEDDNEQVGITDGDKARSVNQNA